jgi:hypothetical protein
LTTHVLSTAANTGSHGAAARGARAVPGTQVHGPPGSANSFAPHATHALEADAFSTAVFAGHTHACSCATRPSEHGVHAPSPIAGFTLSTGHATHSCSTRNLPGAQRQVSAPEATPEASPEAPPALALRAKPAAHTEQLARLVPPAMGDVARNGHAVHAAAPAGAKLPGAQSAQALAPSAAKLPAAQATHALAFADAAKLPGAHALQALAPASA